MQRQQASITWHGEVPVSDQFDDPYYSLENGLEETRHVFLAGNDLPARFCDGFVVAELGFGTGLNLLATAAAWAQSGQSGTLRFVSFELALMQPTDMEQALSAFPVDPELAASLIAHLSKGETVFEVAKGIEVSLIIGDARDALPGWDGQADAWFLDGFSPAKNPELWSPDMMRQVGLHTRAGGTAATYSAAGFVRQGLTDAGFTVTRVPGYGRKRHMTRAVKTA